MEMCYCEETHSIVFTYSYLDGTTKYASCMLAQASHCHMCTLLMNLYRKGDYYCASIMRRHQFLFYSVLNKVHEKTSHLLLYSSLCIC